jgi:hypothetical protein
MTPEERQLLTALTDRIRSIPASDRDPEAEQMIQQLVRERPESAYFLAQTVLMQDFALRNAQAQIQQLQQQVQAAQQQPAPQRSSGSFLGGLFGGGHSDPPPASSVPPAGPWGRPAAAPPPQYAPQPSYAPQPKAYAPAQPVVMQPSQTGSFLRSAATTAAGVAGGALLFQGIESLFSGHQGYGGGGFLNPTGFGGGGYPPESITETTVINNYGDDAPRDDQQYADDQRDQDYDQGGYQDTSDPGGDYGGSDDSGGGSDDWA